MPRLLTYEEMLDKNRGVPIEKSPLELRVEVLERQVQVLLRSIIELRNKP
jgi:hypothetical protein